MWSIKHNLEKCNSCGKNNFPHKAIGLCKSCYEKSKNYAWQRLYSNKNRSKINTYQRDWAKANPASISKSKKKWVSKNRDKTRQYLSTWRRKYRAKFCLICGEERVCEWAHIIPKHKRAPVAPWNLIPLCPTHHRCFDSHCLTSEELQVISPFISEANHIFKQKPMQGARGNITDVSRLGS